MHIAQHLEGDAQSAGFIVANGTGSRVTMTPTSRGGSTSPSPDDNPFGQLGCLAARSIVKRES